MTLVAAKKLKIIGNKKFMRALVKGSRHHKFLLGNFELIERPIACLRTFVSKTRTGLQLLHFLVQICPANLESEVIW